MQKPEWTKIGSGPVEYCVGTDGVTGIWTGNSCYSVTDGQLAWSGTKADFEAHHCQPPAPRHTIRQYADGSCVVESTEQDEQGRPLRVAFIPDINGEPLFQVRFLLRVEIAESADAIVARAVRYVETGE